MTTSTLPRFLLLAAASFMAAGSAVVMGGDSRPLSSPLEVQETNAEPTSGRPEISVEAAATPIMAAAAAPLYHLNWYSVNNGGSARLPGTTFDLSDRFQVKNDFHGGEIGLAGEFYRDFLSVETSARMAIGNVRERLDVSGGTTVIVPNAAAAAAPFGGFLASDSNIGRPSRNDFAFLPQFDIHLKCLLADNFNLTLGYSVLYLFALFAVLVSDRWLAA